MLADISKKEMKINTWSLTLQMKTKRHWKWCHNNVWSGIKNKIEKGSSGECDYEKDYIKIKFDSDDDLPLNKPLKFHLMAIPIRSVFEEDGKLYPQVFLDDTLYELNV